MSERLEERLRRAAQTYRSLGNHLAEGLFLEAADAITELHDERDCVGMAAYEAGYKNGSVHYELEHCPACKNVADLQEALAENAKLRELASILCFCMQVHAQCDDCKLNGAKGELAHDPLCACDGLHEILRELGIEEDE